MPGSSTDGRRSNRCQPGVVVTPKHVPGCGEFGWIVLDFFCRLLMQPPLATAKDESLPTLASMSSNISVIPAAA